MEDHECYEGSPGTNPAGLETCLISLWEEEGEGMYGIASEKDADGKRGSSTPSRRGWSREHKLEVNGAAGWHRGLEKEQHCRGWY